MARIISRPQVIPAELLARVHDADELGVELHVSGEFPAVHDPVHDPDDLEVELAEEPVEIPLPPPRSLIPSDILEAIAAEEQRLLADEAAAEQAHACAETPSHGGDDDLDAHVEVVSEPAEASEALWLLEHAAILREFPREALQMLIAGAVRHHLVDRQAAFREGAHADSFFVVESGAMEAVRVSHDAPEVALAHLHACEPFGLFGLVTRKVRAATVRAIGDAAVVEFRAARLDAVARSFPEARQALARFFKERLLENFLAVSPLFQNLDALGRAALISHFQDRKVAAGEQLVSPGEVQNGIALVTSGAVQISSRTSPGQAHDLATLKRGEYYGIVSALSGLPTRSSITATEVSTLCVLPQKAFNEFVRGYPVLRTLPARLHEAGRRVDRDLFVGDATILG